MEADFSGYATKAGLKCSDGRTIMPEAFQHCDKKIVPLVWQHGHSSPENILGHAVLEARQDGIYAYGFFNDTKQGQNAKALVEHKDITAMSIYANQLLEKAKQVFHGVIREVSLVLSGANPGALIDNVNIAHSDGSQEMLDDEVVIYTGLELEHAGVTKHPIASTDGPTIQDVYDTLTEQQKEVVHYMIGAALAATTSAKHSDESDDSITHWVDPMMDNGNRVVQSNGESSSSTTTNADGSVTTVESNGSERTTTITYADGSKKTIVNNSSDKSTVTTTTNADGVITHQEGSADMGRNVFDKTAIEDDAAKHILSHADVKGIVADAVRIGSLRDAVEQYAVKHGISDIDLLFPDALLVNNTPEFDKRRTEWVASVLGATRHTPFSRVKTVVADITQDQARAKGYIKTNMKKAEWFGLIKRTTSPTTIYKKQQLDRDDIVDITDFDVVAWLKGEMRLMLEEEIARAILIGDGRDVSDEDKIKDPIGASDGAGIRSISNDHELFVTTVNVNIDDANSTYNEVVDAVLDGMEYYKGTGTPDFYCTIRTINMFLKARDTLGRRLYPTRADIAAALGVANVIPVEVMNDEPLIVGIIVNLTDYNIGADKGGEVSLFDDFDIDYNQQKYLIETRLSGALTKVKSALVVRKVAAEDELTIPTPPTFVAGTNTITIPDDSHVVYKIDGTTYADEEVVITENTTVIATPASGYFFSIGTVHWTFTYTF